PKPALLTRTSMPPVRAIASVVTRSTAPASVTSRDNAIACFGKSATKDARVFSLRAVQTTRSPRSSTHWQSARPMALEPPVISQVRDEACEEDAADCCDKIFAPDQSIGTHSGQRGDREFMFSYCCTSIYNVINTRKTTNKPPGSTNASHEGR